MAPQSKMLFASHKIVERIFEDYLKTFKAFQLTPDDTVYAEIGCFCLFGGIVTASRRITGDNPDTPDFWVYLELDEKNGFTKLAYETYTLFGLEENLKERGEFRASISSISETLIAKHLEGLKYVFPGSSEKLDQAFHTMSIKETYYILFDLGFTIGLHHLKK